MYIFFHQTLFDTCLIHTGLHFPWISSHLGLFMEAQKDKPNCTCTVKTFDCVTSFPLFDCEQQGTQPIPKWKWDIISPPQGEGEGSEYLLENILIYHRYGVESTKESNENESKEDKLECDECQRV